MTLLPDNMTIRPATVADCEQIIPLIFSSGPEAFEYVFSPNDSIYVQRFLARTFMSDSGSFSYKKHYVVEKANNVVGSFLLKTADSAFAETLGNLKAIISFFPLRKVVGIILRGLKIETMLKHPVKNRLYIAHVGVNELYRKQGIGEQIIQYCKMEAQNKSIPVLALDVSTVNPGAERIYVKSGFQTKALRKFTFKQPYALKVPDHYYMECQLTSNT